MKQNVEKTLRITEGWVTELEKGVKKAAEAQDYGRAVMLQARRDAMEQVGILVSTCTGVKTSLITGG